MGLLLSIAASFLFLTGCLETEAGAKAANKAKPTVVNNEVGAVESYAGVIKPTLEANYVQTSEEAARYGAEMADIIENGLNTERKLQSGI